MIPNNFIFNLERRILDKMSREHVMTKLALKEERTIENTKFNLRKCICHIGVFRPVLSVMHEEKYEKKYPGSNCNCAVGGRAVYYIYIMSSFMTCTLLQVLVE
jgi:hypothetical protein